MKKKVKSKVTTSAVVIASREEPLLEWTVKNVRSSGWKGDIIVVHDGWEEFRNFGCDEYHMSSAPKPIGCPSARHAGIAEARHRGNDSVIVIDAHMSFERGALTAIAEHVAENPTQIVGCWSGVLDHDNLNTPRFISRHGARIDLVQPLTQNVMQVDWIRSKEVPDGVQEIQCVLGACYGFSIDRYFAIGAPWDGALGWGASEPALCLFNAFCGGSAVLLPVVANHVYRDKPGSVVPYAQESEMHKAGKVLNRIRLIQMLPIPEQVRVDLMGALANSSDGGRKYREARQLWSRNPRQTAGVEWSVSWEDYCSRWWPEQLLPKPDVQEKKSLEPVQPKRQSRVAKRSPNGEMSAGENPAACPRCGSAHSGNLHAGMRIRHLYKRYRYCKKCNYRFVTISNKLRSN